MNIYAFDASEVKNSEKIGAIITSSETADPVSLTRIARLSSISWSFFLKKNDTINASAAQKNPARKPRNTPIKIFVGFEFASAPITVSNIVESTTPTNPTTPSFLIFSLNNQCEKIAEITGKVAESTTP